MRRFLCLGLMYHDVRAAAYVFRNVQIKLFRLTQTGLRLSIMLDVPIAVSVSLSVLNKRYGRIQRTRRSGGAVWEEGGGVVWGSAAVLDEAWAACKAGGSPCMRMAQFHRADLGDLLG